ncbi:hypothetical protein ACHQM5_018610 [Ranunculus cassubicifolius]
MFATILLEKSLKKERYKWRRLIRRIIRPTCLLIKGTTYKSLCSLCIVLVDSQFSSRSRQVFFPSVPKFPQALWALVPFSHKKKMPLHCVGFVGVDPLQAGNVVQLVLVLGLTIGWISTYIFRVSNKEMTYATQLRQYESKVMEKRLEGLTEAELEVLLEQVEEEKHSLASA